MLIYDFCKQLFRFLQTFRICIGLHILGQDIIGRVICLLPLFIDKPQICMAPKICDNNNSYNQSKVSKLTLVGVEKFDSPARKSQEFIRPF